MCKHKQPSKGRSGQANPEGPAGKGRLQKRQNVQTADRKSTRLNSSHKHRSRMDVRVGLWRRLSAKELMLLNCGVGKYSWESLGLQGLSPDRKGCKQVITTQCLTAPCVKCHGNHASKRQQKQRGRFSLTFIIILSWIWVYIRSTYHIWSIYLELL